jgi:hypothetical protein
METSPVSVPRLVASNLWNVRERGGYEKVRAGREYSCSPLDFGYPNNYNNPCPQNIAEYSGILKTAEIIGFSRAFAQVK